MNKLHRKQWLLTAAAVIVFASASLAQTVSMTLTNVGDGSVVSNPTAGFGVYVNPYTATIGNNTNVPVICDDWSDNTYLPESWTATVTSLTSLNSTPIFTTLATGTGGALSATQLYDEAAWLATQLLKPSNVTNPTAQTEISFAIWELTYPYAPHPDTTNPPTSFLTGATTLNGSSISGSAFQTQAASLISQAAAAVALGYNGAGWSILTPILSDPITCSGGNCPTAPPQEFLVYTPESSSGILFAADMLGLLGLAIVFRRRLLRPVL